MNPLQLATCKTMCSRSVLGQLYSANILPSNTQMVLNQHGSSVVLLTDATCLSGKCACGVGVIPVQDAVRLQHNQQSVWPTLHAEAVSALNQLDSCDIVDCGHLFKLSQQATGQLLECMHAQA